MIFARRHADATSLEEIVRQLTEAVVSGEPIVLSPEAADVVRCELLDQQIRNFTSQFAAPSPFPAREGTAVGGAAVPLSHGDAA